MDNTSHAIAQSGLTDKQIAEAVGVLISTAWRWRNGKAVPSSPGHIAKLAAALGRPPRDIRPDLAAVFE